MAWYGFPYAKLPKMLQAPVKWAIIGGVAGIGTALVIGGNPFLLASTMMLVGAALKLAVQVAEWNVDRTAPPTRSPVGAVSAENDLEPSQQQESHYFRSAVRRPDRPPGRSLDR